MYMHNNVQSFVFLYICQMDPFSFGKHILHITLLKLGTLVHTLTLAYIRHSMDPVLYITDLLEIIHMCMFICVLCFIHTLIYILHTYMP